MICQICSSKVQKVCRVIGSVEIYECERCSFGFVDQTKVSKTSQKNKKELYDFEGYINKEKKLRERLEQLTNLIVQNKKKGNILDVGAGFGLFSSVLKTKGKFNFDLIEPTSKIRFIDKSYSLQRISFEKFKVQGNKRYDVIVMMDVLEHFTDPLGNLKKARTLLKKNGILIVQTPNYKSLMARICTNWAWWMIEDHKFFFTPKSLRLILKKAGFEEKYLMTYEDWGDFKKNLDGNFTNIDNSVLRRLLKAIFFSVFIPFYFTLRRIVWKIGQGGLIFTIFRKSISSIPLRRR